MDSSHPELVALRDELERLDYVVVDHGQHICVRMPLLTSVVVTHPKSIWSSTSRNRSGGQRL